MSTQIYWLGNVRITREAFFPIDELSLEAQETAWERHWTSGEGNPYPWARENEESLEKFCSVFDVTIKEFEYGGYNAPSISYNVPEGYENELYTLKGIRLWKYLKVHFRYVFEKGDCPLTGYYVDERLLQPIRDFLERPNKWDTMEDLVGYALNSWVHACNEDCEHYYSFENFIETSEVNGWVFTEDGRTRDIR